MLVWFSSRSSTVRFVVVIVCLFYVLEADIVCVCVLEWDFVAVNAGYGDSGFFFNESGLQWDKPGTFGGWLGEIFLAFLPFPSLPSLILTTSTATAPPRTALPSTDLPPSQQFHLPSSLYKGRRKKKKRKRANKKPPRSLRLVPRHPPALLDKSLLRAQIPKHLLAGGFAARGG